MENYAFCLLICGGIYNLFFAMFHTAFWWMKIFNWKGELPRMSPINRSVIQLLNSAVIIFLLLSAYISLAYPQELLTSNLGKVLLFGTSFFWFVRLVGEFAFKDKVSLKQTNLILVIVFTIGVLLYLFPAIL